MEQEQAVEPRSEEGSVDLREQIVEQLRTIFDPEIPVNIYELGLIYEVNVAEDGSASIVMTLTSPMCPAAEELPPEVETKARGVPGVTSVQHLIVHRDLRRVPGVRAVMDALVELFEREAAGLAGGMLGEEVRRTA